MSNINLKHTTSPISNAHITIDSLSEISAYGSTPSSASNNVAQFERQGSGRMDQAGIKTRSESVETDSLSERLRSFQASGIFGLLAAKL